MSFDMGMPFALLQQLIGGQQAGGGGAPPIQPPGQPPPLGAPDFQSMMRQMQARAQPDPTAQAAPQMGPPSPQAPQMGPPSPQDDPLAQPGGLMARLGGFGQGIDSTLQSPSKMLGIGALSEINPYLGMGGLLAGGLFGGRRGN